MQRKKKISLIYEFLSEEGGLERVMITHANFLKESGYDVEILTCHLDKKLLKMLDFRGIPVKTISRLKTGSESLNLAFCMLGFNTLNNHKSDLYISYSAPCNYLLRNKKTKKINYSNHYPHFLYLNGKEKIEWAKGTPGIKRFISVILSMFIGNWLKKQDMKTIKKQNLIFANSEFTKKRLDTLYGIKTIVSYPPLGSMFKPSKGKIKEYFIFSSGRIVPDKKYDWLIRSMSYVKNKIPMYISGSAKKEYKDYLLSIAAKYKVELKFLGRITLDDLIKYYSSAQVFVFPTPLEDFGLVPAESLVCGTPVIVWGDGAGPTEQVIDSVNGYHAKPYDLKDFAKKIDLALDKNIKIKNKKKIIKSAEKFSYKEIKKDFVKNVQKVLSSP